MTRAARTVYIFGIYLIVMGGVLIGAPNTLLALLRVPPTTEPWIHILGVTAMSIGLFHVGAARSELRPFFQASVRTRFFAATALTALVVLAIAPPIIIGFAAMDAATALWTRAALREARPPAQSAT